MLNGIISLGDKLNVKRCGVDSATEYFSKLLDIVDEETISIAMPIVKSQVILMDLGCTYNVTFYTEKGVYRCKTQVVKRYKVKNIFIAELKVLDGPSKIQRREFYRFECRIELDYSVLPMKELDEMIDQMDQSVDTSDDSKVYQTVMAIEKLKDLDMKNGTTLIQQKIGVISDLSGGGIKFKSDEELKKGEKLILNFSINNGSRKVNVLGKVIASEESMKKNNMFEHRVQFIGIKEQEREEIVRYILNEERKLRQKEKGFL